MISVNIKKTGYDNEISGNITVRGCKYTFTISVDSENKIDKDSGTWDVIAEEVTQIALGLIQKKQLYKAEVTLSGFPNVIDPKALDTTDLKVQCARVKAKDGAKYKEFTKKQIWNNDTVKKHIDAICDELKNPTPSRRSPIPSNLPSIEVDSKGRCLDKSIAYQILSKKDPSFDLQKGKQDIERIADLLRNQAAQVIKKDEKINTPEFFDLYLIPSIREIPAFSKPKEGSNEESKKMKQIQGILEKKHT